MRHARLERDARHAVLRALAILARVLDEVADHAAHVGLVGFDHRARREPRADLDAILARHAGGDFLRDRRQIDGLGLALRRAGVVDEGRDDAIHLLDVVDHRVLGRLVGRAHLGFEPQPRERRAQVVRDTREHQRAVGLELLEVTHHLVEAAIGLGRDAHPALGQ